MRFKNTQTTFFFVYRRLWHVSHGQLGPLVHECFQLIIQRLQHCGFETALSCQFFNAYITPHRGTSIGGVLTSSGLVSPPSLLTQLLRELTTFFFYSKYFMCMSQNNIHTQVTSLIYLVASKQTNRQVVANTLVYMYLFILNVTLSTHAREGYSSHPVCLTATL